MRAKRPLAAVVVLLLVVAALVVRWEDWTYEDAAGKTVFEYHGLLIPGQEAQAPPPGVGVARVTVHKRMMLGFNRYDYVGAPGSLTPAAGYAARTTAP